MAAAVEMVDHDDVIAQFGDDTGTMPEVQVSTTF
jgi:hypothetical protein